VRQLLLTCLLTFADPGKLYPLTFMRGRLKDLDGLMSLPVHRVSEGWYHERQRSRQHSHTHPCFGHPSNWSKRRKHGYQPAAMKDIWRAMQGFGSVDVGEFVNACHNVLQPYTAWTTSRHVARAKDTATVLDVCMSYANTHKRKQEQWRSFRAKKATLHQILMQVAPRRDDVIVLGGNYDGYGHQHCRTWHSALPGIVRYLAKRRRVLILDEYHTTQACCQCWNQAFRPVTFMRSKDGASVKGAVHCAQCGMTTSRDANAARNMALLARDLVSKGIPPPSMRYWPKMQSSGKYGKGLIECCGLQPLPSADNESKTDDAEGVEESKHEGTGSKSRLMVNHRLTDNVTGPACNSVGMAAGSADLDTTGASTGTWHSPLTCMHAR